MNQNWSQIKLSNDFTFVVVLKFLFFKDPLIFKL